MVERSGSSNRKANCAIVEAPSESTNDIGRIYVDDYFEIREIPDKGYGVFTRFGFTKNQFIGGNLGLEIPSDELGDALNDYVFEYDNDICVLAMGSFSYLNHSNTPNCEYEVGVLECGRYYVEISAYCDIQAGEELTINYHGDPENPTPWNFGD